MLTQPRPGPRTLIGIDRATAWQGLAERQEQGRLQP
jgi:hypothetical protein